MICGSLISNEEENDYPWNTPRITIKNPMLQTNTSNFQYQFLVPQCWNFNQTLFNSYSGFNPLILLPFAYPRKKIHINKVTEHSKKAVHDDLQKKIETRQIYCQNNYKNESWRGKTHRSCVKETQEANLNKTVK